MINLLISIATIALVDSINPNAMAVQIYLLSTPKPVARAITFIAGDFTARYELPEFYSASESLKFFGIYLHN